MELVGLGLEKKKTVITGVEMSEKFSTVVKQAIT